jgi:UPF0755 protein
VDEDKKQFRDTSPETSAPEPLVPEPLAPELSTSETALASEAKTSATSENLGIQSETTASAMSEATVQENSATIRKDPSEVEEIRKLLADVPTTKSGTITFTKTAQPVRKVRSAWRVAGFILLLLMLAFLSFILYVRQQLSPVSPGASVPTEFEVEPGWGASQVASKLEDANLIRNARFFTFYLRRQNLDRAIGEGLYDLNPAMSSAEVAATLNKGGRPRVVRVVVPEGFRMKDIAAELSGVGLGDTETLLVLFQKPGALKPSFVGAKGTLEGYLFPASYDIPVKSTPEEVVKLFLKRFQEELTPEVQAALDERGWSVPGWVTLASMVQAEAANTSEMPIITGVFLNRLDDGMLLQSDPTVAYGLGKDLPELDVNAGDFQQENVWNTYTRPGLPETPINNPGREALQAVFEPVRENEEGEKYFYFLHGTDEGQPIFRPNLTLEDHERDVELYLR